MDTETSSGTANGTANGAASAVMSVTTLNQRVARLLERSVPLLWVAGEVSNFTRAASGHWYFTLKDANAQIRAVMFKNRAHHADIIPREGEQVEVRALVTLYTPRGDYQLSVEAIRRAGLGNLYEAFLQLKQKLSLEGLFAADRKRGLPLFARCIGIVTSPSAAALRDILITLQRRAPHVSVIIYPAPVQGTGSALKLARAIELADARQECDVLIVARGGGSMEDLWSFNDEGLARSIANCTIPVITGIGHETDFTIADFVADLRAPTPTAAAEMAVTPRADFLQQLDSARVKIRRAMRNRLDNHAQTLDYLARRSISPLAYIRTERSKMTQLMLRLRHAQQLSHQQTSHAFNRLSQQLRKHFPSVEPEKIRVQQLARQIHAVTHQNLANQQQRLQFLSGQLELLNPQRTLERGYAILQTVQGDIITSPHQINAPMQMIARLAKGNVALGITKVDFDGTKADGIGIDAVRGD